MRAVFPPLLNVASNCRLHKQMSTSTSTTFLRRSRSCLHEITSQVSQLTLQEPHVLQEAQKQCQLRCGHVPGTSTCVTGMASTQQHGHVQNCAHIASAAMHERNVNTWGLLLSTPAADCSPQQLATVCKDDEVMHAGVLQWLGALGTYAATTHMWLWRHAPQARVAKRVCVQWVGASVGEVEAVPLLEALLLHSLPQCQVQSCLLLACASY